MMRKWLSVLVALVLLPEGRGFLPAPPATRLLLRGSANGTPGRVRRESRCSASLRAILDKIPLPQSPRPSEIMKRLENKEVQGSLDRFIKSAPEGLKRAAEAAIPVAKAVLFNEDLKKGDALPAGWTEHLDEKTGLPYYYAASTASTVWQRPTEPAPPASRTGATQQAQAQINVAAPDSSSDMKDLARLMHSAVADTLPSADETRDVRSKAFDSSSISLSWGDDEEEEDAADWMLDSASYKPK